MPPGKDDLALWEQALTLLSSRAETDKLAGLLLVQDQNSKAPSSAFVAQLSPCFSSLSPLLTATTTPSLQNEALQVLTCSLERAAGLVNQAGVRRELSTSLLKILPGLMQLLQANALQAQGDQEDTLKSTLAAFSAALTAAPAALRQTQALESCLKSILESAQADARCQMAAASCLSKLPRCAGTADAWSSQAHGMLASAHACLGAAFMGMEGLDGLSNSRAFLPADVLPPAAWSSPVSDAAGLEAAVSRLRSCLTCLEHLLTGTFPVAVPIPARAIVALAARMLAFQPAAAQMGRVLPSQEAWRKLRTLVPGLHSAALLLLTALLPVGSTALAPLQSLLTHLANDLLRRVALTPSEPGSTAPEWHATIQMYRFAEQLLLHGAAGVALQLAPAVTDCALLELYTKRVQHSNPAAATGRQGKKRKKHRADVAPTGLDAAALDAVPSPQAHSQSCARQTAVLCLINRLLLAGGAYLPAEQRAKLDAVVVHAASTSATLVEQAGAHILPSGGSDNGIWGVQCAALGALQSAVLTPARHRPVGLPEALALFRQGLHAPMAELVQLSTSALLNCEAFLHPRSVPHAADTSGGTVNANAIKLGMPAFWRPHQAFAHPGPPASEGRGMLGQEVDRQMLASCLPQPVRLADNAQPERATSDKRACAASPDARQTALPRAAHLRPAGQQQQQQSGLPFLNYKPPALDKSPVPVRPSVFHAAQVSDPQAAGSINVAAALDSSKPVVSSELLQPAVALKDAEQVKHTARIASSDKTSAAGVSNAEPLEESDMEIPEIDSGSSESESASDSD